MVKGLTPQNVPLLEGVDGRKARRGRILITIIFTLYFLVTQAQTARLQGQWQLLSVTRSEGTIVYYNWEKSKELNASPVVWGFEATIAAILNDTTLTPDKMPTDTVEAARYHFSGDTLIMENYFTKGEAETSTNAPVVKYKVEKCTPEELLLILYDTGYYNAIRPMDKYSKRYVFKKIRG